MFDQGIYGIECVPTGKLYVGMAVNRQKRCHDHIKRLENGTHSNRGLQSAWNKYGASAFAVKMLEEVADVNQLVDRESWWLKHTRANEIDYGFNSVARGSNSNRTHGMTGTPTFKSWESMLQRCTNPKAPDYPRYGGAGIRVARRWASFKNFLSDMGARPAGTSLDRYPNKHGGYKPGNCRWATASQQQRNKRNSRYVTYKGVTKHIKEWAADVGIPSGLLAKRIAAGITGEKLFAASYRSFAGLQGADGTTIRRQRRETRKIQKFTAHGKTLTVTEWAEELGIPRHLIATRLQKYKMPPEQACTAERLKGGPKGPSLKPRLNNRFVTAFGRTQTVTQWAEEYKMPVRTLHNRLFRAKMAPEIALTAPIYAQQRGKLK